MERKILESRIRRKLYVRFGGGLTEKAIKHLAGSLPNGFQMLLAFGYSLRGWALAEQGQGEEGIKQIQQGLSGWRAAGSEIGTTWYLALLSEALGRGGQAQDGLHTVSEALAFVDRTGEGGLRQSCIGSKGTCCCNRVLVHMHRRHSAECRPSGIVRLWKSKRAFTKPSALPADNKPKCGSCARR